MATQAYPPEFYTDLNRYLDHEWLCPYCVAPTQPGDKNCPHCKKPLVFTRRVSLERSAWLWRGIFLQVGLILLLAAAWTVSYALVYRFNRISGSDSYLPLYVGLPVEQPEELVQKAMAVYPLWLFWSFAGAIFISMLLILLLYFRVKHGNTIYMISATAMLAAGLTLIIFFNRSLLLLVLGGVVLTFGAGQMLVTLNLWNDFKFKSERLRLVTDGGVKNHASFYLAGRKYADMGLWGLAVIHYRRAVARQERNAVYHLALAIAYQNISRPDLAKKSLDAAEKIDPDSPEIWQVRQKLNTGRLRRLSKINDRK